MHAADNGPGGVSTDTARRPGHDAGRVSTYARSRLAGEVLARAAMSPAYRADRAEELERSVRPNAYCWFSFALVAVACVCLIVAAALGEAWLLAIAVALALSAAALAACA